MLVGTERRKEQNTRVRENNDRGKKNSHAGSVSAIYETAKYSVHWNSVTHAIILSEGKSGRRERERERKRWGGNGESIITERRLKRRLGKENELRFRQKAQWNLNRGIPERWRRRDVWRFTARKISLGGKKKKKKKKNASERKGNFNFFIFTSLFRIIFSYTLWTHSKLLTL